VKAKRVLHLQMEVYVGCLGMVAQMQKTYKFFPFTFLLLPWRDATHLSVFITGIGVINQVVVLFLTTFIYPLYSRFVFLVSAITTVEVF